jgi:hypothetical protein
MSGEPNNEAKLGGHYSGVDELLESLGTLNFEVDQNGKLADCLNDFEASGNTRMLLRSLSKPDLDLDLSVGEENLLNVFRDEVKDHVDKVSKCKPNDSWHHDTDWIPDSIGDGMDSFNPIDRSFTSQNQFDPEANRQEGTTFEAALLHPDKVFSEVAPHQDRLIAPVSVRSAPAPSLQHFASAAGTLAQKMAQSEQSRRFIDRFLKRTQRRSSIGKELQRSRVQVRQLIHDDLEFTTQQLMEQMEANSRFRPRRRHSLTMTLKSSAMLVRTSSPGCGEGVKQEEANYKKKFNPRSGQTPPSSPRKAENVVTPLTQKDTRRRRNSCVT